MMPKPRLLRMQKGTVKRAPVGSLGHYNEDGEWVEGNSESNSFTIKCSVQPITGNDTQLLPQSFKISDSRWLYTSEKLRTMDEYGQIEADKFIFDGIEFEVLQSKTWQQLSTKHYKFLIAKVEKS